MRWKEDLIAHVKGVIYELEPGIRRCKGGAEAELSFRAVFGSAWLSAVQRLYQNSTNLYHTLHTYQGNIFPNRSVRKRRIALLIGRISFDTHSGGGTGSVRFSFEHAEHQTKQRESCVRLLNNKRLREVRISLDTELSRIMEVKNGRYSGRFSMQFELIMIGNFESFQLTLDCRSQTHCQRGRRPENPH